MQNTSKRPYRGCILLIRILCDKILPFLFFTSVIFGFDKPYIALLTILSAAIHELSHVLALLIMKSEIALPRAKCRGFGIRHGKMLSYGEEFFLYASGPLANLLLFLLLLPFCSRSDYLSTFAMLNLFTALCSLLPIEDYDGYGALSALLMRRGKDGSVRFLYWLSFALSALVCFLSLYFIRSFGETWWIFFSFFYSLLHKISKFLKPAILEN